MRHLVMKSLADPCTVHVYIGREDDQREGAGKDSVWGAGALCVLLAPPMDS